ncbi:uncharacterized protein SPPG_03323 [Spizellomyces punctatus DAOM BR117]|uniref:Uncharacterized protein n=1 Tax=Spizellomyces punctatus (strain DAOM BR117) TaxID=645134 RepID=A0A0L0HL06_SPIPD|nr:uncharacterized protein SPPG_03323 [Spizellomyces punctatus DAOM BR117]KND01524.1 hypothetical protein SPPG_03323 [Spizellomyces punctatus DAOM BR117]|eukprot:XP_016609563.1 hypothetical protein SPPG_03323 [Spizellomyces punctatus DAOM BR117]
MPPSTSASSGAGTSATPVAPLGARLSKLVLSAQFVWFLGHLVTVIQATLYILSMWNSAKSARNYSKAYYGIILSYGIIMYKAHGIPQFNSVYFQRLMRDENSQYFLLALLWCTSKPLAVTLLPYFVFSLFHSVNYFRSEILPALLPPSTSTVTPRLQELILKFVKEYQSRALRVVAYAEVWVILPVLTIGILFGWSSLLSPIFYARFLMFRYFMSPMTKAAFADMRFRLDGLADNPSTHEGVRKVLKKAIEVVSRFGDENLRAAAGEEPR